MCDYIYLYRELIRLLFGLFSLFIIFVKISAFVKPYVKVDKDASTRMPYISESKKQINNEKLQIGKYYLLLTTILWSPKRGGDFYQLKSNVMQTFPICFLYSKLGGKYIEMKTTGIEKRT